MTALHVGYMDTDMIRHLDVPKSDPAAIAKLAIDGIAAGDAEIIADETSRRVLAGLSAGVAGLTPRSPDPPGRRKHARRAWQASQPAVYPPESRPVIRSDPRSGGDRASHTADRCLRHRFGGRGAWP